MTRSMRAKVALWLAIIEGWATRDAAVSRFGSDAPSALAWLCEAGFAEGAGEYVRWVAGQRFDSLWSQLFPERPCPIQIDPVVAHSTS